MAQSRSFASEALDAIVGTLALLTGRRDAASRFDFTLAGVAGSLIALVLVAGVDALLPRLLGASGAISSLEALVFSLALFAVQLGVSVAILNWLKRLDAVVPFFVTYNWSAAVLSVAFTLATLGGVPGEAGMVFFALMGLVVQINIGRLILTLRPLHIAAMIFVPSAAALLLTGFIGVLMSGGAPA